MLSESVGSCDDGKISANASACDDAGGGVDAPTASTSVSESSSLKPSNALLSDAADS
jgi:hypothetical protein